ncbi:hypothetical protein VTL71DRAFT_12526 [Oculimacula yallundae]|uniref:Secreted protein n=1 Tax=Oculimacula yallundae TaxID=86028 RepID=A0ABR4CMS4_9HELO
MIDPMGWCYCIFAAFGSWLCVEQIHFLHGNGVICIKDTRIAYLATWPLNTLRTTPTPNTVMVITPTSFEENKPFIVQTMQTKKCIHWERSLRAWFSDVVVDCASGLKYIINQLRCFLRMDNALY